MYPFGSKEKDGGDHTHLRSMVTKTEPIHPPPLLGKLGVQAAAPVSHGSRFLISPHYPDEALNWPALIPFEL